MPDIPHTPQPEDLFDGSPKDSPEESSHTSPDESYAESPGTAPGIAPGPPRDEAIVVAIIDEDAETTTIVIDPASVEDLKVFHPGQFATLRILDDDGWSSPHPFTLSGAPHQGVRLTVRHRGGFTARGIPRLRPGDAIKCAGPYGVFCRDIASREDIVLIAGGMGITPFLSVLRHFARTGAGNRITLFWANRTFAGAFAADELADLTRTLNLRVVHVLSRETNPDFNSDPAYPAVAFEKGHVDSEMLQRHLPQAATSSFYLCAPAEMRRTVLAELQACGVDMSCVESEDFSFV